MWKLRAASYPQTPTGLPYAGCANGLLTLWHPRRGIAPAPQFVFGGSALVLWHMLHGLTPALLTMGCIASMSGRWGVGAGLKPAPTPAPWALGAGNVGGVGMCWLTSSVSSHASKRRP